MNNDYFETLANSIQESENATPVSAVAATATLTVKVDIDCKLYCDGDFLDLFEANKVKKITIPIGQHLMTIESEHYESVIEDQVIDAVESGKNYLLIVNDMKQKEIVYLQEIEQTNRSKEIEAEKRKLEEAKSQKKHFETEASHMVDIGNEYYTMRKYDEALKSYRKAIDFAENAEAQFMLGACYFSGLGVHKDIEESIKWFTKSAEQGYLRAQYELGCMYNIGSIVPVNKTEAAKWYKMAAEQGNMVAQIELGKFYYYGIGVPQNYNEAIKWFKKAADQKNSEAMCMLGICYYNGEGITKSNEGAVRLWKDFSKDGDPQSQYSADQVIEEDKKEAVKWLTMAADNGNEPAQSLLGMIYAEKLETNKDRIVETLDNYGIPIDKIKAIIGPTVTLYEIIPATGIQISKIKFLEDDICLSLAALGIRIIVPIPGKDSFGIEVPNKKP